MIWLTRPRQPRSAAQPILRLLPLEQEGLHGLIYASVVSVRSVPIAVVLDQDARRQLIGHRLGPLEGSGRVAGGADHDHRRGALGRDRLALRIGLERHRGTADLAVT